MSTMGQRVSLRGATAFETWDGGFLKMRDPQVTIGFNTKMVIHDLDDLGVSPFFRTAPYIQRFRWP